MKIAVVILNWNGEKLLKQFLPTVIEYSKESNIYMVDNASTDNSVGFVATSYPEVKIIQNKKNGGFSKGYNTALKDLEEDVFCLLNSDVEVSKNWLPPIVETLKKEPKTAIIQPKILDFKRKEYFEYAGAAGGYIDKYGYPYCRGRIFNTLEEDKGQYDDNTEIFWASGACFFIRNSIYKALNGLDESFFAHMEEIDLCWRAKNLGHNVKYNYKSKVYHVGGATLKNTNPKKTYLNFRNSLFTLTKNSKGLLLPKILVRLILDGIAGFKFLLEFKPLHTFAIVKAHFSFYYHINHLIKQRKSIKTKIKYYQINSIVFNYFVKRKSVYKNL